MLNEKFVIMMNEFVDGELEKEKENFLFTELGQNDEAREYFKSLTSIKMMSANSVEKFPSELDGKILTNLKESSSKSLFQTLIPGRISFLAYSVLIIMLTIGYFLFNQISFQQTQLELANQRVIKQERLIQLIMSNQLPPVTVRPDSENEIVIQATM